MVHLLLLRMRYLILALFFNSFLPPASAQVHLGISAGANLSFWQWRIKSIGRNISYDPAVAWRTALLAEWQITPQIALRAETGIHTKANRMVSYLVFESDLLSGNSKGRKFQFRENFQYWENTLMIQVSPVKKVKNLYLLSGCSWSWLQNAWSKTKGSETGMDNITKRTPIDLQYPLWNRNAFNLDFGVGGNIPINKLSKVKIETRFSYNLSSLVNNIDVDTRIHPLFLNIAYLHQLSAK